LNISYSFSDAVSTCDVSVYGTGSGFLGKVKPGATSEFDWAAEYSVSQHWVAAIDVDYLRMSSSSIHGTYSRKARAAFTLTPVEDRIDAGRLLSVAPAVEYNFNADVGIIVGAIIPRSGRNASASITPTLAINMYF
jgi:hypothetical protein